MIFKCIIIDDEPLAIKLIRNHISNFKQFEIVAECENAIEASFILQNTEIDLLFVDIQMPGINGIEFLRSLIKKPSVIITSAYKEFAIEGFDLDVVDFLLKPITLDRFFKGINKFLESRSHPLKVISPIINDSEKHNIKAIFIKDTNKTYRINPLDILYIEGMREYVKVVLPNENIITKSSLINFYNQLPKEFFIRTHKSFIINIKAVKAFTSSNIEIGGKKIPIGRSYKIATVEMLNKI